jgi:hypothetical protein
MIGTLIGIVLTLIILGVILWAVQQLLPLVPLPHPFGVIINVLITVIAVIIVVWIIAGLLGVVAPIRM